MNWLLHGLKTELNWLVHGLKTDLNRMLQGLKTDLTDSYMVWKQISTECYMAWKQLNWMLHGLETDLNWMLHGLKTDLSWFLHGLKTFELNATWFENRFELNFTWFENRSELIAPWVENRFELISRYFGVLYIDWCSLFFFLNLTISKYVSFCFWWCVQMNEWLCTLICRSLYFVDISSIYCSISANWWRIRKKTASLYLFLFSLSITCWHHNNALLSEQTTIDKQFISLILF